MSIVTCGYCGESGTREGENFVQLDCIHDMWCTECKPYKERLDRKVAQGNKFKNRCNRCGRKWVGTLRYEGMCKICLLATDHKGSGAREET